MAKNGERYSVLVLSNGDTFWYQDDKLNRLCGPAIEYANGRKEWVRNGKRTRLDGPAVELPNGEKYWMQDDKLSRLDGPAIEWPCGHKAWYINGEELTEEEFNKRVGKLEQ